MAIGNSPARGPRLINSLDARRSKVSQLALDATSPILSDLRPFEGPKKHVIQNDLRSLNPTSHTVAPQVQPDPTVSERGAC